MAAEGMPSALPELRDIHLPAAIGWWPPAPGWWLSAGLALGLVAASIWFRRRRGRPTLMKQSLQELEALMRNHSLSAAELVRGLSALLRRVCISAYPRADVASLTGTAWLTFLDRHLGGEQFTNGPGRVLSTAPYHPDPEIDEDALLRLCRAWIQALPRETRRDVRL